MDIYTYTRRRRRRNRVLEKCCLQVSGVCTSVEPIGEASGKCRLVVGLLRHGWNEQQAEALAERLTQRDADDDRRTCVECLHCRPGLTCDAYRPAGVGRELGRDLATPLQRCPAFASSESTR